MTFITQYTKTSCKTKRTQATRSTSRDDLCSTVLSTDTYNASDISRAERCAKRAPIKIKLMLRTLVS